MSTNILNSEDRVMKSIEPMEDKLLEYSEFVDSNEKINISILLNHLKKEGRLHPTALNKILQRTQQLLRNEPNMIEITGETAIFGDLHGQFYDLMNIYQDFENSDEHLLFLGDYVDRGCFGTEVCILLFCLKLNNPQRVNLLRGNHECRVMTNYFNFKQEVLWKYNSKLYDTFMNTFDCLPLCAIVNSPLGKFFCVHGGISPALVKISEINSINRFCEPPEDGIMCDLLWSDPADDSDYEYFSHGEKIAFQKQLYSSNNVRGCSYYYGFAAVKKFLARNDLVCIVRAHEVQENGCKMNFQCCSQAPVAITIFTAPNYCDCYENDAAVLMIENEELSFLSYTNTDHPFWLPKFTNAIRYTLPILFQELDYIASSLWTSVTLENMEEDENDVDIDISIDVANDLPDIISLVENTIENEKNEKKENDSLDTNNTEDKISIENNDEEYKNNEKENEEIKENEKENPIVNGNATIFNYEIVIDDDYSTDKPFESTSNITITDSSPSTSSQINNNNDSNESNNTNEKEIETPQSDTPELQTPPMNISEKSEFSQSFQSNIFNPFKRYNQNNLNESNDQNQNEKLINNFGRRRSFAGNVNSVGSLGETKTNPFSTPQHESGRSRLNGLSRMSAMEARKIGRTGTLGMRVSMDPNNQRTVFEYVESTVFMKAKKNDLINEHIPVDIKELKEFSKRMKMQNK